MARTTPENFPFFLRYLLHPYLTHGSVGQSESSFKTTCRSVQPFSYGSQMLCCTMYCQWGRNPENCPFSLVFRHPAGRVPSHGDRQHAQKSIKIARVVRDICSRTDRHTQTHTQTCSLPYFVTSPAGEVNIKPTIILQNCCSH